MMQLDDDEEKFEACELDLNVDSSFPQESTNVEISYQVMSGVIAPKTLRLKGFIKGKEVAILIDCGSTHNFIQMQVVKSLHLLVESIPTFFQL